MVTHTDCRAEGREFDYELAYLSILRPDAIVMQPELNAVCEVLTLLGETCVQQWNVIGRMMMMFKWRDKQVWW